MSHRYTDWHPPMMAFLWHYLDMLVRGPLLMLVMQALLWWGGWLLIVECIVGSVIRAVICVLIAGLWPATGGAMGTILKDMQMATTYLCSIALLLLYRDSGSRICILPAYALLFYGTGVRHNAIIAVFPILIWAGVITFRHMQSHSCFKRIALTFVPGLIIVVGPPLLNRAMTAPNARSYVQQMLFVYDLGAVSTKANKVLIPDYMLTRALSVDEIRVRYTPISAVPMIFSEDPIISQTKNPKRVKDLQGTWLSTMLSYPGHYLSHRFEIFGLHLWFGKTLPLLLPEARIAANDLGFKWYPSLLAQKYWNFMQYLETNLTWLFRPWIYCTIVICFLVYSAAVALHGRRFTRHHTVILTMSCSGILYILSYLPLSISAGYRYSLWTMMTGFICLFMLPASARESMRQL